jgi:hypothetical protein
MDTVGSSLNDVMDFAAIGKKLMDNLYIGMHAEIDHLSN